MNYGITPQGFARKPYSVLLEEHEIKARTLFGDDIDLSDHSPLGLYIKLCAWRADRLWQLAEDTYYSLQIEDSEGVSLEKNVSIGLQTRKDKQKAIVKLTFTGVENAEIPVGTLVESTTGRVFETIDAAMIAGGTAVVWASATEAGYAWNVAAWTINTIKTPLSGVDAVINDEDAVGGADIETDPELKTRYKSQRFATGSSIDAITTALLDIESVEDALVDENTDDRSIEAIVLGGEDSAIAEALLRKKAGGIRAKGDQLVYVTSADGEEKAIRFSRPEYSDIYVRYNIVKNNRWSSYQEQEVKRLTVAFIGGYDDTGTRYPGRGLGGSILHWQFYSIFQDMVGVADVTIAFGLAPDNLDSADLIFSAKELPRTSMDKIEVIVE